MHQMKNVAILFTLTFFFFACHKDDKPDVSVNLGEAKFTANGVFLEPDPEEAITSTIIPDGFDLHFPVY